MFSCGPIDMKFAPHEVCSIPCIAHLRWSRKALGYATFHLHIPKLVIIHCVLLHWQSTLPQYFSSAKCLICEAGYQATVCHKCLTRYPEATVVALNSIVGRQFQQEQHVSQVSHIYKYVNETVVKNMWFQSFIDLIFHFTIWLR